MPMANMGARRVLSRVHTRQRHLPTAHRVHLLSFFLMVVGLLHNLSDVTAFAAVKETQTPPIEILKQDYSFSHGVKKDIPVAFQTTEIKGSDIHRSQPGSKPSATSTSQPAKLKPSSVQPATTASPPVVSKPRAPTSTVKSPHGKTKTPIAKPQVSALWPFELSEELTQQELMVILVVIVSSMLLLGLSATALWNLVAFALLHMREQRLLRALFTASISAEELEKLVQTSDASMPLLMKPLAKSHLRLARLGEVVDKLLETTRKIEFKEAALEITGLPETADEDNRFQTKPMTFFHILSVIESLQCQGESIAVELTTLVVPVRWTQQIDMNKAVNTLKKRLLELRQRHNEIHAIQQQVVKALEQRHVNGEAVDYAKLEKLVAALRQVPAQQQNEAASASSQPSSPPKLRSPKEGKDEFGFFLRSFDELNQQHQVQVGLKQAFSKLTVTVASSSQSQVKVEEPQEDSSVSATSSTSVTARIDSNWSRTLEGWVDRADEMEMTHLTEVKRAQYMLEDAKRESFCMLNSSRDAMQSVESLKASLVSLGADPKAAVLTAAEIYSSRSNMLMLTTTLRTAFDEFRKGDMIKMEDRRRRHAQKEREKRERAVAKFRMKQHLLAEKMELQRAFEREQQERERARREKEEFDAFVKQAKEHRKQFVWAITKLDVLIVLIVMAIVFFDSLTTQLQLLKPVCSTAPAASGSSSVLGFSSAFSASWWPGNSISLLTCRVEYAAKVTGLFLLGIFVFYIVAQLNLLTTTLPVVIAVGLYYLRTEWMNMLFRLPVLLVLYGFNSMVLYLLNRSFSLDDPKMLQVQTKRRALLLYVAFPVVSVLLSIVVSITIACDNPHECVVTAIDVTHRSFASLWQVARHAYHL